MYLAARRAEPTPRHGAGTPAAPGAELGIGGVDPGVRLPHDPVPDRFRPFPHPATWKGAMGGMLLALGPWLALILLGLMAAAQLRCRSLSRELQAAAQAPRASGPAPGLDRPPVRRDNTGLWRGLLLLCAAGAHRRRRPQRRPARRAGQGREYLYGVYWPWIDNISLPASPG